MSMKVAPFLVGKEDVMSLAFDKKLANNNTVFVRFVFM